MISSASISTCLIPSNIVAPECSELTERKEMPADYAVAADAPHQSWRIHLLDSRRRRTSRNRLREAGSRLSILRAIALKSATAGMSVMFTLLLLELGVRVSLPQPVSFYDGSKIRRISSSPPWLPENIPNGRNDSFTGVPVRINSLGLRGEEVTTSKPAHTVRIIGVGDSIAFGFGVREK